MLPSDGAVPARTTEGRFNGDSIETLAKLQAIPEDQYDALSWSDLSAASIAQASKRNAPALLVDAIAAADASIALKPELPQALFNRALAIERLGLRDAAATGWRAFLTVEPTGPWADEARIHLRSVSAPLPAFQESMERVLSAIIAGDASAARRVVDSFPHQSRMYVETDALGAWAQSYESERLIVARAIAREIAQRGDPFILDCIDAIEAARPQDTLILRRAHADFSRGRRLMRQEPGAAELLLRNAALLFSQTESSMAFLARYCAAVATFDQNRRDEALSELQGTLAVVPERYRTLRAQILWQLGLVHGAAATWGASIAALNESAALFDATGELYNAAFVRQILSEVCDAIGNHDKAWEYRAMILRELGQTTTLRTQTAISAISYAAAQTKKWRIADSMLAFEIEISAKVADPPSHVDALLRRAVVRNRLDRRTQAAQDLRAARGIVASMRDDALRTAAESGVLAVEALIAASPRDAIQKLTATIDFNGRNGREMYLPAFLLQRGRACLAIGDHESARRDFDTGIARLERDRHTLAEASARFAIFDAAEELFIEAIDESLRRGDVDAAFAYAERARARALLDILSRESEPKFCVDRSAIPPDVAIVEYISLDRRLVAFVVTRNALSAVQIGGTPTEIAVQSARMRDALAKNDRDPANHLGRLLYDQLFSPIAYLTHSRRHLVFIANRETAVLPFAALRSEDNRYLLADYVIHQAPSVATYLEIRPRVSSNPRRALVVAASVPARNAALSAAESEGRRVAAEYENATLLSGPAATVDAFIHNAPDADVLHFAGHGVSVADGGSLSALIMSSTDKQESLSVRQIESLRLPRTEVVVLAACNTARGEVRWSEGTLSVARSFLAAGTPTVIATLWSINDELSAEFFAQVHRRIAQGIEPANALQETQLDWVRSHNDTSMWAAVQSIGH
ncbi:MAG TPA: CHAT domain-containing protein [Thermoanaerobaculia bacterium]|nr:CHAT domain-containing protein [Thermoanaerobaculia bacterium]